MTAAVAASRRIREAGKHPLLRTAAYLSLGQAVLGAILFLRWATFGNFAWAPLATESALAQWPPIGAYLLYGTFAFVGLAVGVGLLRVQVWAVWLGIGWATVTLIAGVGYFALTGELYGSAVLLAMSGMTLVLLLRSTGWSLAFPAALWLAIFFLAPMFIVLIVSLGERARLGTVVYPAFEITNLGVYFDDYFRFFGRINGDFIYLRIFWRSVGLAALNTIISLLFGYPFAYWIARRPYRYRGILIFLVMIPFWTNFLVRTYAWMLILRDSGLINNFWTITLHEQAVALAIGSDFFAWLAEATSHKLPLLFNQPAVFLGLFYGYLPFVVLPIYSNLERIDWSLLEAAADLGANTWQTTVRILLPITRPGIVAAAIIVFIPSLGAYITPDLMGGAKVTLLGNLLQQQFMTVRDWPFGSAIGFIMMAIMLLAILIYFRTVGDRDRA